MRKSLPVRLLPSVWVVYEDGTHAVWCTSPASAARYRNWGKRKTKHQINIRRYDLNLDSARSLTRPGCGRCRTCRHWGYNDHVWRGRKPCRLAGKKGMWPCKGPGAYTSPTFGCVLHSQKSLDILKALHRTRAKEKLK